MRTEVYMCDVCKKQKGEANHWFIAFVGKEKLDGVFPMFRVQQWNTAAGYASAIHLCGHECAQKKLSEFMNGCPF